MGATARRCSPFAAATNGVTARGDSAPLLAYRGGCRRYRSRSNGVGDVDEHVPDAEPLLQEIAQRPHAEGLGRVVAGGQEVDAGLVRAGHDALRRLPGQERVEALRDG